MENIENVVSGIFMNSLNPGFCVRIVEKTEDPIVEYILCNKEFSRLVNGKDKEFMNKQIPLSRLDQCNKNNFVGTIVKRVLEQNGEVVEEIFNPAIHKTFHMKAFVPVPGYIGVILADVTEYADTKAEAQKMYEMANNTAEQLKYQVDLLTATQNELKRINRIHEIMFTVSSDGFFYKNYETGIFYAADSFYDLFTHDGIRPIDNMSIINGLYEKDVFTYTRTRENALNEKKENAAMVVRLPDGKTWLKTCLKFNYDEQGTLQEEVGFFKDITLEKRQQEELAYHAYYDAATGLMNRSYFTKLLDEDIEKIKEDDGEIQVIYIDVDDFKKVNDSIGFQFGDQLILEFSRILRKFENNRVRIGRFDSDEFAISIYDGTRNEANTICLEIRKILTKPFELGHGISNMLSVSIGIAGYPAHGRHAVDVISNADLAVHHVKNNGKNGVVFFEESMLEHLLGKIEMEKNITYALENDNFLLYYQPQYFADSQKLRGFEALIRMQDDNDGVISPVRFIPVAEKNGSIVEIGEWVINQAMEDYAYWKKEYGFEGVISINISAIQFRQIGFENILYDAIERHRIDPSKIEIEITESVFVDNQIQVIETVKRIRQKGIRVSLDDFGTGYSSLSYLRRFPVDTLKIDKSFVDFIGKEEKSDIIISALVGVARSLGLEIVAEGVETTEQSDILKDLKCHVIQGYLYGKPMDGSSAEDLIRRKM